MRKELTALRNVMRENNIDIYMVPTTDFHGSEYVSDHFKCREFLTGFTGSNGTAIVTLDDAFLWTDGRYFLQAASQLKDSGFTLMKSGEPEVPTMLEFLIERAKKHAYVLGFDGRVVSGLDGRTMERDLKHFGVSIESGKDLIDMVWHGRPPVDPATVYQLPMSVTGKTPEDKLIELRKIMASSNADFLLTTSLEEIAWLFNLRGADIVNTPVFFAFALISQAEAKLFVYDKVIPSKVATSMPFVQVNSYTNISDCLKRLPYGMTIWIDNAKANYYLCRCVPRGINVINKPTPIELMKAVKNDVEIKSTLNAHKKDGIAMVKFISWLKDNINDISMTEMSAAEKLDQTRKSEYTCFDLSFPTISGYNANGAIIHYEATPETNADLSPEGFLLVDSGGQYEDGTTDITRTIALGPLTNKMKEYYTAVLKSHIALASTIFDPGTTGLELDAIARQPLKALGLDFNHGTGHGVGHMLSVHEGPNIISKYNSGCPLTPGMITSDEPGVYIEGEFGIRLENELLCIKHGNKYAFEPITYCPFDRDAILASMMTPDELKWLNSYHEKVYDVLAPSIKGPLKKWLKAQTASI